MANFIHEDAAFCLFYDIRHNFAEFMWWIIQMLYEMKNSVGEFAY